MHVTAIIAAGGAGRRIGAARPKQLLEIAGRTILQRSVEAFARHSRITDVIVALPAELVANPPDWVDRWAKVRIVAGGATRQASVAAAFDILAPLAEVILVHDAARPFVSEQLITRCIEAAGAHGGAIAAVPVRDTVKQVIMAGDERTIAGTIPRESIYLAQTPQAFRRDVLTKAVAFGRSGADGTDEAALAELAGYRVHIVEGDIENVKITTPEDLERARRREAQSAPGRVGTGYDLHRLVEGRALVIGGVTIPFEKGAFGHSDADVACHAATDAVLGAAALGDIGGHFPDTDPRWKGASSLDLLRQSVSLVVDAGFGIENLDVVIVLERPKIAPHVPGIRANLAAALGISPERVSVKGKTNEGVDAVGRGEAIAAHAVALLTQFVLCSES
ncbi:MAG: 2-C-methyl-D-erythritol 4-phosphate cytidylyltransferase [Acidobacteria bacterium]|nr:2-C-methyl-D-erythritol 4-phosphate cytidylyltransferase [Acidobacteriota bacterium]